MVLLRWQNGSRLLFRASLALVGVLALAGPVHADAIKLKTGGTLENVKIKLEGDFVRIQVDRGSIVVAKSDVLEVVAAPTHEEELASARDQLAQRKLAAGEDPTKIRAVASWARQNGLGDESEQLGALARGIELDCQVEALAGSHDVAPYLALARSLGPDFTPAERACVLEQALRIDPDNASVRDALGQVKRGGRWVTRADAARLDAETETREMSARGLVRFEGQSMTPEQCEALRRQAEADRQAALAAADPESGNDPYGVGTDPYDLSYACAPGVPYGALYGYGVVRSPRTTTAVSPYGLVAPYGSAPAARDRRAVSDRVASRPSGQPLAGTQAPVHNATASPTRSVAVAPAAPAGGGFSVHTAGGSSAPARSSSNGH